MRVARVCVRDMAAVAIRRREPGQHRNRRFRMHGIIARASKPQHRAVASWTGLNAGAIIKYNFFGAAYYHYTGRRPRPALARVHASLILFFFFFLRVSPLRTLRHGGTADAAKSSREDGPPGKTVHAGRPCVIRSRSCVCASAPLGGTRNISCVP